MFKGAKIAAKDLEPGMVVLVGGQWETVTAPKTPAGTPGGPAVRKANGAADTEFVSIHLGNRWIIRKGSTLMRVQG